MKYQAKIENGIVTDVIAMDDNFTNPIVGDWVDYTINDIVSVGDTYTLEEGFRSPKPYSGWVWNETYKYWEAPVQLPDEENIYEWDNDTESWKLMYIKYVQ